MTVKWLKTVKNAERWRTSMKKAERLKRLYKGIGQAEWDGQHLPKRKERRSVACFRIIVCNQVKHPISLLSNLVRYQEYRNAFWKPRNG